MSAACVHVRPRAKRLTDRLASPLGPLVQGSRLASALVEDATLNAPGSNGATDNLSALSAF